MNNKLEALEPNNLWKNFKDLTQIPRPSKKEGRVIEFVKNFGQQHNLETTVDKTGNVIIRKPATTGMEKKKGVIFQAHLDMVPQKNNDKKHNFETDPIEAYIDGEWVKANGTTLGADNGIGVATMLSILESKNIKHGPIECLFTIDEETGMTGAFALQPGILKGEILINLDSEDEGELYIGCAGGMDANFEFDYIEAPLPKGYGAYLIKVSGLRGGHSGLEINLGRGNANQILFRILRKAETVSALRLSEFEGGNMRNAIPRESSAKVLIPDSKKEILTDLVKQYNQIISKELSTVEKDLKIEVSETSFPERVLETGLQKRIIAAIYACPNGVVRMTDGIDGLVETSTNLSIINSAGKKVIINCLLRSSVDSAKENIAEVMHALFDIAGAKSSFTGSYPGWKPNMNSEIMKVMDIVYQEMFNKKMEIKAVHAGLECGIIGGIYPNFDMVSIGPTIRHPHSPDEKVNIPSVSKFWNYLLKVLVSIPDK